MLKNKDNVDFSGSVVQVLDYLLKRRESGEDAHKKLLIRIL